MWTFHQAQVVSFQLFVNLKIILVRITPLTCGHINNMKDNTCTLNVAEKLCSQPNPLASTFNQSWKVGHGKALSWLCTDHSQVRNNCRKVVGTNLWFCCRYHTENCWFTNRWETNQTNISQNLQFQLKFTLFTWFTIFSDFRGRITRCRKTDISTSTTSTVSNDKLLAILDHVSNNLTCFSVTYCRTRRDANDKVLSSSTMHTLGHPFFTVFGFELPVITEIHKGAQAFVNLENDWATLTTVTAPRTAIWHIFFTTEGNHPIATTTSFDTDLGCI